MDNRIKTSIKITCIYFLLYMLDIISTSKFTGFYSSDIFDDILCESSAAKLTGVFTLLSSCAHGCTQAGGCMSFFYASTQKECYSVNSVLASTSGCQSRAGVIYFMKQAEQDCYNYTQRDQDQMTSVLDSDQCESYHFHKYIAGNNATPKGCEGCSCCKQKGCYENVPRDYNGTWSHTKYGRRCQRWDSQWPHEHTRDNAYTFPLDPSVFDAHNYCRDPDYEGSPWCYTVDQNVRWEFCNIPRC